MHVAAEVKYTVSTYSLLCAQLYVELLLQAMRRSTPTKPLSEAAKVSTSEAQPIAFMEV